MYGDCPVALRSFGKPNSKWHPLTHLAKVLAADEPAGHRRRCHLQPRQVVKLLSRVRLFVIPWTVAHQAPPSMGFSRQEYWSGLPFPSPGDLPNSGIKPRSPALWANALTSEPLGKHYLVLNQIVVTFIWNN